MDDKEEIHTMAVNFFSSLFQGYHAANGEIRDTPFSPSFERLYFFLEGLGTLSEIEADSMIEEISLEEVEDFVKNTSNNKSPGLDGLNYEFYKSQLPLLGLILVNVLNFQLSHLSLLPSNLIGATRLVSKVADNEVPLVSELRPITLLNSDYKILTGVLSKRILKVLRSVIKSSQSSCVPGANICSSAFNLVSLTQAVEQCNGQAAILSLDLYKAYDDVNLQYLEQVLLAMNFDPVFVSWILLLSLKHH